MAKAFASQADLTAKKITFDKLGDGVYGYTAEGDPNAAVVVGDDGVMVVDALATPVQAQGLIREIRKVTRKPIKYVVLTHYHAVRVLGASAYKAEHVIASRGTYELIRERGAQDFKSEVQRFPRLFEKVESVPGLTWPTMVFENALTLWMGRREVRIMHLGRGHTKGDTVVWLPKERIMLAGDLVERGAAPYCGDAYLTDWPDTLERLRTFEPRKLVPGRGPALKSPAKVNEAIDGTKAFVSAMLKSAKAGAAKKQDLGTVYRDTEKKLRPRYGDWVIFEHCLPFNVSRALDEAKGIRDPRIWTAKRDLEMWKALEG
jgi:glyoxylase-like metal-dependent hydrolase (beta-lactamase superfamily II)